MSGYTELSEYFRLEETAGNISIVRAFHDDGGPDDLPELGDRYNDTPSSPYYNVRVVRRVQSNFGGHPNKHLWEITYNSDVDNAVQQAEGAPDISELPKTVRVSGEIMSIEAEDSGFKWSSGEAIDQPVPKHIGSATISVTKRISFCPLLTIAKYAGHVNSGTMRIGNDDCPAGTVLFEGADLTEYFNEEGQRRWKMECHFSVKYITEGVKDSAYAGWLYLYNKKTGLFELVTDGSGRYLYPSANIQVLLAIKETP